LPDPKKITSVCFLFQVTRPITLKKDGIQTRNRKLAARAKRVDAAGPGGVRMGGGYEAVGGMQDFFRPGTALDTSRFGYGAAAAVGMHGYLSAAGSAGYYGQMHAAAAAQPFVGHHHHPMASMASMAAASNLGNTSSFGSPATGFSLGSASASANHMMAGATA
jgi:hypothetical protein